MRTKYIKATLTSFLWLLLRWLDSEQNFSSFISDFYWLILASVGNG